MRARTITTQRSRTRKVGFGLPPEAPADETAADAPRKPNRIGKYIYKDVTGKPEGRAATHRPDLTGGSMKGCATCVPVGYVVAREGGKQVTDEYE